MTPSKLATLQALDPALVAGVLQQAEGHTELKVTGFTVEVLNTQGVMSSDSLFLLRGHATIQGTSRSWSLVLKILTRPSPDEAPENLWYWKREYEAFHSGLLSTLPGPLRAPRHHALMDRGDQVWLWMEYVVASPELTWSLDQYTLAAGHLGRLNGAYLTGTPLPEFPWLLRNPLEQWATMFGPGSAWEQSTVRHFFPPTVLARVERLWEEQEQFYRALRTLPQVFSHFDFHRRNLFISGPDVVAVDWAWCGVGPLGGDLSSLIGATCMFGEWDVGQIELLDAAVFGAYLEGLRDAGWLGDPATPRLGYVASMALHFGVVSPTLTGWWSGEERQARAAQLFAGTPDELAQRWAALCTYSLDRADEARELFTSANR